MGWQEFMVMERRLLDERRQGKLREALGVPLAGETQEQLERIGERDRLMARHGLVALVGADGRTSYRYINAWAGTTWRTGWQRSGWKRGG